MTIADLIAVFSTVLTVASIGAGIWVYWRQMNAQLFLEFTKRYDEVMSPLRSAGLHGDLSSDESADNADFDHVLLRYLNLCSEEFCLYTNHFMSKRIWIIWEAGISRTIRSRNVLSRWATLKAEFVSFPAFVAWIDSLQRGHDERAT